MSPFRDRPEQVEQRSDDRGSNDFPLLIQSHWPEQRLLALALGCGLVAVTLTVSAMLAPTAMEASHRYGEAALLVAMCLAVRR